MSLILIYETQKLFCYLEKNSNGVYYPRTYHMIEYLRVEKRCSPLNIWPINIINLLNDDCNLEGFSFKHLC